MPAIATQGTATNHGGAVLAATGGFNVGGQPAAKVGDPVSCPLPGHEPCWIATGSGSVKTGGQGVARVGDLTTCGATLVGPPTKFTAGG